MRRAQNSQNELRSLIEYWRAGNGPGRAFTTIHHIPAREAKWGGFPKKLDARLKEMLRARGFKDLYVHQSAAIEHAIEGRNVVLVTPTASGKSLAYNLPVLDSLYQGYNALYLFPTKALSQDQCAELNTLMGHAPDHDDTWEAQVYDGDTPPDVRKRIRRSGRLVVTNPDMLHSAIMPNHKMWIPFFRGLKYVIIDELHTYRGVFGSHVANVIRRLMRIARHYGVEPVFICTSATIANPKELAESLTEEPFECVTENGAPASERFVCFMNPPITDPAQMRRQSPVSAAGSLARTVLTKECGTIVFTRSRQSVEVLINRLKERLKSDRNSPGLHNRVASYRGGYLPNLRRSIERGLRDGSVLGVVSTNALELGIDIGSLDVCILAGYPGTVASTWQQIGRSGRSGGTSVSIVIAGDDPLDQFIIQNPEYFFERSPESARIGPDNLRIIVEHLKCATFELSLRDGESFGGFDAEQTREIMEFLEGHSHVVQLVNGEWKWCADNYPASEINLRNIADENFVVVDITRDAPKILAEVDFESAHTTIYPNAVYQVSGEPYRVERLDYDERRAYVRESDDGYYTTAMHYAAVKVLEVFGEKHVPPGRIGHGEVAVTDRFVGYKKIKFGTGENVGYGELNLPELELHTTSYWLELRAEDFPDLANDPTQWARTVAGISEVMRTAASLKLMCDPRDLQITIGSVQDDSWLSKGFDGLTLRDKDGVAHTFDGIAPPSGQSHASEQGRVGPVLYDPTIFIYDRFPGGVGFGEGLYEDQRPFMRLALDLIQRCPCDRGCPSCVGPPEDSGSVKDSAEKILGRLAFVN